MRKDGTADERRKERNEEYKNIKKKEVTVWRRNFILNFSTSCI
jgi:hypothetical protein